MSSTVQERVKRYSRMKGSKLLLLCTIAEYADEYGFAWLAMEQLAGELRVTRRQVQRLVKQVSEVDGELAVVRSNRQGFLNGYYVLCGLPQAKLDEMRRKVEAFNRVSGAETETKKTHIALSSSADSSEGGDILGQGATSASTILPQGGDIFAQNLPEMSPPLDTAVSTELIKNPLKDLKDLKILKNQKNQFKPLESKYQFSLAAVVEILKNYLAPELRGNEFEKFIRCLTAGRLEGRICTLYVLQESQRTWLLSHCQECMQHRLSQLLAREVQLKLEVKSDLPSEPDYVLRRAWELTRDQLRIELRKVVFETWVSSLYPVTLQEGGVYSAAKNTLVCDKMREHAAARAAELLSQVLERPVRLAVLTEAELVQVPLPGTEPPGPRSVPARSAAWRPA